MGPSLPAGQDWHPGGGGGEPACADGCGAGRGRVFGAPFGIHPGIVCNRHASGNRRRRGYDRGFVLSDHADWPSLLRSFRETGARRILLTHGHTETMCRYLREQGVDAAALATDYGAEDA